MDTTSIIKVADGATLALAIVYAVLAAVYAYAHHPKWIYWAGAAVLTYGVTKL